MAQKPQKSFNGGVIAPRLWQQVDLVKYQSGLATCTNVIPIKEGALLRRPGTEFIYETKESRKARLFKFEFSPADTYIIELTATDTGDDSTLRFYRNGAIIEDPPGSGIPYEIDAYEATGKGYVEDEIFKINSLQNFDRYFLFINTHQTKLLTRKDHDDWEIEDSAWLEDKEPKFRKYEQPDPEPDPPDEDFVYANVGIFFQNRLFLGGLREEESQALHPALVMGSVVDHMNSFDASTPSITSAIKYEMLVTDYNFIYWFNVVKDKLLIGTSNSERLMGGSSSGAITGTDYAYSTTAAAPNPPEFLMNSAFGSSGVIAEPIGDTIVTAQAPGFKLRNYSYEFESDKYVGANLNRLTEHLTRDATVKQLAYQDNPEQVLWVLRNNGILQSLTFVPEEEVFAWAVQEISDGTTIAKVESIEVIPTADDEDEIWLVVRRLINGVEKRYVERFTKQIRTGLLKLPSFSPPWGDGFDAPLLVRLISGSIPGDLYYTFDGSDPSPSNGMLYSAPFYIENPTTIKVVDAEGNIVTGIYNFAGDRLHDSKKDPLFDGKQPPLGDPLYAVASTEPPPP